MKNGYKTLVTKPEGKRSFEIFKCIWEENIKPDFRDT
jgi:hypothetical protein